MSECGSCELVTGTLSPVHASCSLTCFTTEIGISAFSLICWEFFDMPDFIFGNVLRCCRCVRLAFFWMPILYSYGGPSLTIFAFCWLCCAVFLLLLAWMRTAFLAGGKCGRPLRL